MCVKEEHKQILQKSKAQSVENASFLKKMRKVPKRDLDKKFEQEHDTVFKRLDCIACANCCKTTSPIFKEQDIKRLAKLFKKKPVEFIDEYLKVDEDNDYVLKSSPCPFLMEDNKCFVYDVRPQACSEYPHTNRKNMYQILDLTHRNTLVCPAVAKIVTNLKEKI